MFHFYSNTYLGVGRPTSCYVFILIMVSLYILSVKGCLIMVLT